MYLIIYFGVVSLVKAHACTVAKPYLRTMKQLFPFDLMLWTLALTKISCPSSA
jgi:hypothetical protein